MKELGEVLKKFSEFRKTYVPSPKVVNVQFTRQGSVPQSQFEGEVVDFKESDSSFRTVNESSDEQPLETEHRMDRHSVGERWDVDAVKGGTSTYTIITDCNYDFMKVDAHLHDYWSGVKPGEILNGWNSLDFREGNVAGLAEVCRQAYDGSEYVLRRSISNKQRLLLVIGIFYRGKTFEESTFVTTITLEEAWGKQLHKIAPAFQHAEKRPWEPEPENQHLVFDHSVNNSGPDRFCLIKDEQLNLKFKT